MVEGIRGALLLLSSAACLMWTVSIHGAPRDIVFDDFESPRHEAWTATGAAFAAGPAAGRLPRQGRVLGYQGQRLLNSFVDGDGPQGELTSAPFRIERRWIHLLVGGGRKPGECEARLLVDGRTVAAVTGADSEELLPEWWDVSPWLGKLAQIAVVDHSSAGWGHILVDDIVFTDGPGAGDQLPATYHRRCLFVPFRCADTREITPHLPAYYRALAGRDWPGVSGYFREDSYGRVDLDGSQVWDYVNLPQPKRFYQRRDDAGRWGWDSEKLLTEFAAANDQRVDFIETDAVVFFPNVCDDYGGGGATWVPLRRPGWEELYAVGAINPTQGHSVWVHELSHHLHVGHVTGPLPWSVMDAWGVNYPVFGGMGLHHTAWHKWQRHWFTPWQVREVQPGSTVTITLERLACPTNDSDARIAIVRQRGAPRRYYTVEARRRAGFDSTLPGEGVVIVAVDESRWDREQVLVWPPSANHNRPGSSAFKPGQTYRDDAAGIVISPLAETGSGYTVRIANG